jgi:DNA mismatch endonuclease (patch repair protein)
MITAHTSYVVNNSGFLRTSGHIEAARMFVEQNRNTGEMQEILSGRGQSGGMPTPTGAAVVDPIRSATMSRIRSRDTAPEILVRKKLHALGLRFRLHRKDLPGSPDIVLPGRRVAVFVNGCFWHQHPGCRRASRPKTRQDYWGPKLARNVARDTAALAALQAAGWTTLVIWECEARDPAKLEPQLDRMLVVGKAGRS